MNMPNIGLGTFRLQGQQVIDSVRNGLEAGYRHIDTAQIYGNEAEVGQALADSGVAPREVFVTTKIWTEHLGADAVIPSLKESLRKLRLEQVNLTLVHWPSPGDAVPVAETMAALLEARAQGLTGAIGVSNFTIAHMRSAIGAVGAHNIATNQVEIHPYLQNRAVAEYARGAGIPLTAYMPLAYGKVMDDAAIVAVAARHGVSGAQVTLAWLLQKGYTVIPSSTRRANLEANLQAAALRLSAEDVAVFEGLDRSERIASPDFAPGWD
jgi:2,5-diketo-D-gluconate reductase B